MKSQEIIPSSDIKGRSQAQVLTWLEILFKINGIDLGTCPNCGGKLVRQPLTFLENLKTSFPRGPLLPESS
ncbi:MAG: hypothetical protein ACP5VS_00235 [Desulfomonilaceae bacterium]